MLAWQPCVDFIAYQNNSEEKQIIDSRLFSSQVSLERMCALATFSPATVYVAT